MYFVSNRLNSNSRETIRGKVGRKEGSQGSIKKNHEGRKEGMRREIIRELNEIKFNLLTIGWYLYIEL